MKHSENLDKESLWPAFRLGLGAAVGVGLARFAYALVLPSMRTDMNWNYALSGFLNTANSIGYVCGSISAYLLLRWLKPSKLFIWGLIVTSLTLLATGFQSELPWLVVIRFINGTSAAWLLACGSALVAARYQNHSDLRMVATGVFFSGAGIGIAFSCIVVNPILAEIGYKAWPIAWLALGIVSVIASIWPFLESRKIIGKANTASAGKLNIRGLYMILISYFLFACGYIVYMTFIFAWIQSKGISWEFGTLTWFVLGSSVAVSPFIWQRALGSWNPSLTLSACCFMTFLGSLLPIFFSSVLSMIISAWFFGLGMFIAPSSVAVLVQKTMVSNCWAKGITMFTTVFSLGQAIGPIGAGWIADIFGLDMSLIAGVVLLAMASILALISYQRIAIRLEFSLAASTSN